MKNDCIVFIYFLLVPFLIFTSCKESETVEPDKVTFFLDDFPNKKYYQGDSLNFRVQVEASAAIQFIDINLAIDEGNLERIASEKYFKTFFTNSNKAELLVNWKLDESIWTESGINQIIYIAATVKTKKIETREISYFKIEK